MSSYTHQLGRVVTRYGPYPDQEKEKQSRHLRGETMPVYFDLAHFELCTRDRFGRACHPNQTLANCKRPAHQGSFRHAVNFIPRMAARCLV